MGAHGPRPGAGPKCTEIDMKRTYIAAAALLLGTSAFAWAPAKDKPLETTWEQSAPTAGDPDLDLAENPDATDPEAADTKVADTGDNGVGGPLETADAAPAMAPALDLATRPATQNYPPCAPGPGDDNCIQLYEPGVRTALAGWNQPAGGLADGQSATAMGGPYEPVGGEAAGMAMNGDGVVDPALGETAAVEVAQAGEYSGVGGPIAETGYPPCAPGPGDDRCIQLYEPGVTGAGN